MGVHAGEPEVDGDHYVGLDVSRAARICAAGHGGQVVVSSAARSLLGDDERAALREARLKPRLKDFPARSPCRSSAVDALPGRFPALRAERTMSAPQARGARRGRRAPGRRGRRRGGAARDKESAGSPRSAPTSSASSTRRRTRSWTRFRSASSPARSRRGGTTSGSQIRAAAPCAGSTSARAQSSRSASNRWVANAIAVGAGAVWLTALRGDDLILVELDPRLRRQTWRAARPNAQRADGPVDLSSARGRPGGGVDSRPCGCRSATPRSRNATSPDRDDGRGRLVRARRRPGLGTGRGLEHRAAHRPSDGHVRPPDPGLGPRGRSRTRRPSRSVATSPTSSRLADCPLAHRCAHEHRFERGGRSAGERRSRLRRGLRLGPEQPRRDARPARSASGQTTRIELGTGRGGVAVAHGLVWVAPGEPVA